MAKSLVYCFLTHGVHIKFSLARLTNITSIFTLQSYQSTWGLGYKIYLPECRTDARKFFFGQRVIHTWNSLKLSPASMSTLLSMTSWSPASHPGLVSRALLSPGSSHICHLVAAVSNVKLNCLPGTHPPAVSPRLCPWSTTLRHVHHSSQYPHFLLFPKPSPVCRWYSALSILPPDSLRLQHRSPSQCYRSNFVQDDWKSSYNELLQDWISAHWSQ